MDKKIVGDVEMTLIYLDTSCNVNQENIINNTNDRKVLTLFDFVSAAEVPRIKIGDTSIHTSAKKY